MEKSVQFKFGPIKQTDKNAIELHNNELDIGASCSFDGIVRADKINGSIVACIEFTAEMKIAETEALKILDAAGKEFKLISGHILHSLGKVNKGQSCFYVSVNAGHRKEAFAALQFVVDSFKSNCPVFGKEVLENGESLWKENS